MASQAGAPRWRLALRRMHALSALVLFSSIGLGLSMTHFVSGSGLRFELYQWHKSFGVLAFALVVFRLIIRLQQSAPEGVGEAWQKRLASVVHKSIYGFLLLLPLTGWAMVSASPLPVPTVIFGLWTLPPMLKPDLVLYQNLKSIHQIMSWAFCVLVLLHLAGGFAHRRSGILGHMWALRQK